MSTTTADDTFYPRARGAPSGERYLDENAESEILARDEGKEEVIKDDHWQNGMANRAT